MNKIGIIGQGRFGSYLAKMCRAAKLSVVVSDDKMSIVHPRLSTKSVVETSEIVVLAVPINELEDCCKNIAPLLVYGQTVIDVCSVKTHPCEVMSRILPLKVRVVGTHPLFGPQSAPESCSGQRIVICPVREKHNGDVQQGGLVDLVDLQQVFARLGLTTIVCSEREHDYEMAKTQLIDHFIGRSLMEARTDRNRMSTKTHEKLMDIVDLVKGNSQELFIDMNKYNPFAEQARLDFIEAAIRTHRSLPCKMSKDWFLIPKYDTEGRLDPVATLRMVQQHNLVT